jgi:hypothetical protein
VRSSPGGFFQRTVRGSVSGSSSSAAGAAAAAAVARSRSARAEWQMRAGGVAGVCFLLDLWLCFRAMWHIQREC